MSFLWLFVVDCFKVVIVGRANVGKSTLLNRLLGRPRSIVCNTPNVTRDRVEEFSNNLGCSVVDTAGMSDKGLPAVFLEQTLEAISNAGIIFFMVDGKHGLIPEDVEALKWVRKINKDRVRIVLVINKIDCSIAQVKIGEFKSLGLGEGVEISAEHGIGIGCLREYIGQINTAPAISPKPALSIALIGQPNVGKSSLTNRLLGYKRVGVSDVPGTTREAIGVSFHFKDHLIRLVDNAGTRRRYSRDKNDLENKSMQSSIGAIEEADVSVLVVDGGLGSISSQDLRLANAVITRKKPLIIAINKSDIGQDHKLVVEKFADIADEIFLDSTVIGISAKTGLNCDKLIHEAIKLYHRAHKKIPTNVLNQWLHEHVEKSSSPKINASNKIIRLKHLTQCGSAPQRFKLHINTIENTLGTNYERHIINKLRAHFKLKGVPIDLRVITSKNPYAKVGRS